jgi:hypothetical protein
VFGGPGIPKKAKTMLRKDIHDLLENGDIGDWAFSEDGINLWFRYPDANNPNDNFVRCNIRPTEKEPKCWLWDGNREAPTLTPSINVIGRWHGFFRAGILVTA